MKKNKFLTYVNVALGSMSMALAGCHAQKSVTPKADPTEPDRPLIEEPSPVIMEAQQEPEPVVCKYGVPPEMYERPVRKYGIPDVREK